MPIIGMHGESVTLTHSPLSECDNCGVMPGYTIVETDGAKLCLTCAGYDGLLHADYLMMLRFEELTRMCYGTEE